MLFLLTHTCLHCSVDGRDGSPEQQGLLIEVVLVGVRMLLKRWDAFGGFPRREPAGCQGSGGEQGAEKQAGRNLLCELLCPPVLRSRSVRLQ